MPFFDNIAWDKAWYASVLPCALTLSNAKEWRVTLNQLAQKRELKNHHNLPLQFITQEELPEGIAYESHISTTGKVPTRENLHDFFNALVWLSFPQIKRQLNAMQSAQINEFGIGKSRGPARDAATIFDENAAILVLCEDQDGRDLYQHLKNHQWQSAFINQSHLFSDVSHQKAHVWCFGHALMEKLVNPYKAITAHTWVVWVNAEFFQLDFLSQRSWIDQHVTHQLKQQPISTADYTPLPILGIPNWWPNQDLAFYEDTQVFRPKRVKT